MANFDLSKLMEGKNPQAVMLNETRQLRGKWEKTGLLEGLKERDQHSMAVLLENQAKQLLDEATQTGVSAGSEEWSGVALPLVRRIFGEIASKEFVSVQPMNLPSGLIFYLDFKYASSQGGEGQFGGTSLFGGTNVTGSAANFGRTNSATNGLYGEGRYGYSVNDGKVSVAASNITSASATWADLGFDAALSASVADGKVVRSDMVDYKGYGNFIIVKHSEEGETYHFSSGDNPFDDFVSYFEFKEEIEQVVESFVHNVTESFGFNIDKDFDYVSVNW